MVPNPFRLVTRILPGRGGSETDASEDASTRDPVASGSSEAAASTGPDDRELETEREPQAEYGRDAEGEEAEADRSGADEPAEHDAPEADATETDDERRAGDGGNGSGGAEDISDIPAPSVGPHTTFRREDPEERLARHEQSDVDAMGLDKRREVVGGSYGPSIARQATLYGLFLLVVGLIVVGAILAVNEFDQPPAQEKYEAPWKGSTDPAKPSEIDFPRESAPGQVPVEPDSSSKGGADRA